MKFKILTISLFSSLVASAQQPIGTRLESNRHPVVGSAVKASRTTVGGTASKIPATPLAGRMAIVIYNNGTEAFWIGGSTVTANNGLPLSVGESIGLDVNDSVDIYGISDGTSINVRELEL